MDSWKTCFNAYKISKTQELPGASPPGPTGCLKAASRPPASDTVSRPPPQLEFLDPPLATIWRNAVYDTYIWHQPLNVLSIPLLGLVWNNTWILGHLSHSGDLLLSVFVRRRPSSGVSRQAVSRQSSVGRKFLNIFSFFSGTTEPISTRFGL
jgi:hypothetical protein